MTPLDVALAGRWKDWHGLEDLAPGDLEAAVGPLSPGTDADLAFAGGRAWVRDGRVVLVALDAPRAPAGAAAAVTAAGAPASSEPARQLALGFATTDHVFPERGLVLVSADPYEDAPERAPKLLRAELFGPRSLEDWRYELARLSAPPRPHRW
jgi:hypothetical protein